MSQQSNTYWGDLRNGPFKEPTRILSCHILSKDKVEQRLGVRLARDKRRFGR